MERRQEKGESDEKMEAAARMYVSARLESGRGLLRVCSSSGQSRVRAP